MLFLVDVKLVLVLDLQHKFKSLTKTEKQLREDYNNYISEVSAKFDLFSKKQKETQALFADLMVNYGEEQKLKAIDQVAEVQVIIDFKSFTSFCIHRFW